MPAQQSHRLSEVLWQSTVHVEDAMVVLLLCHMLQQGCGSGEL